MNGALCTNGDCGILYKDSLSCPDRANTMPPYTILISG